MGVPLGPQQQQQQQQQQTLLDWTELRGFIEILMYQEIVTYEKY